MSDLEQAEHGATGKGREWLARATRAPRDPAWIADGVVSDRWAPISPGDRPPRRLRLAGPAGCARRARTDHERRGDGRSRRARGAPRPTAARPAAVAPRPRAIARTAPARRSGRAAALDGRLPGAGGRSLPAAQPRRTSPGLHDPGRRPPKRVSARRSLFAGRSGTPCQAPATRYEVASPVSIDRDAAIAQLVEHLIRNEGVGGSNPSCGTKIYLLIQWLCGAHFSSAFFQRLGRPPGDHSL